VAEPLLFIKEVVKRIRAAAGKDFIIGVRMSGDDFYPGPESVDNEKAGKIARELENTGVVDLLNISVGHGGLSNTYTIASMYIPPASISVPLASGIKQAVKSIPVIACGRINDPAIAEKAIAEGHCDMVGLVRGRSPTLNSGIKPGREGARTSGCALPVTRGVTLKEGRNVLRTWCLAVRLKKSP